MTDTKKYIQELKNALPSLRERVVAVALLLALSLVMIASVSYAWVTMSVSPELGGVKTTAVANGNLEIALSDLDGLEPNPSSIADSSASQSILNANLSWGNMINLSSGYGIEELILRPAVLDPQSDALLKGVKYSEDGRVVGAATDFGLTSWMFNNNTFYFGVPANDAFGVRAISSVGFPDGKGELLVKLDKAEEFFAQAIISYNRLMAEKQGTMQSIVQQYINDNIDAVLGDGGDTNSDCSGFVEDLAEIIGDFYEFCILPLGDGYAELANIQKGFKHEEGTFTPYTRDTLNAAKADPEINLGNGLSLYLALESATRADVETMNHYVYLNQEDGQIIYWNDISPIINRLIEINSATVAGYTADQLKDKASGGIGGLMGLVGEFNRPVDVIIYGGNLRQFELISGARMKGVSFKLNIMNILKPTANMRTSLTSADVSKYSLDVKQTERMNEDSDNLKGDMVAQDTYGMVLDLWFRTNAGTDERDAILTLDGLPEIQIRNEPRMIILSGESEARPVYVYNRPTGVEFEGLQLTDEVLVYLAADKNDVDKDGDVEEEIYYDCTTYAPVYVTALREVEGPDDTVIQEPYETTTLLSEAVKDGSVIVGPKIDQFEDVIGFTSSNRVWNDGELDPYVNATLGTEISATQGSGSCYVFHADSPEAYASALQLLSHLQFAFLDVNNTVLAEAELDTEHIFAESGKYTVPLRIISTSYETQDANGELIYGITALKKNVAQRISVVVYLNGQDLENNMVMAKDSIVGGLNLQFSTVDDLRAIKDTGIMDDFITLRVESAGSTGLVYQGETITEKMTAYVEGMTPGKVELAFQRRINAVQGTQMEKVLLKNTSGSVWECDYPFNAPGTYVLSSIWVDGVEYRLADDQHITLEIQGFEVQSINFCDAATAEPSLALTVDSSVTRKVSATIKSNVTPSKVSMLLEDDQGGYVTAVLSRESATSDTWSGTATFTSSGSYTPRYVVATTVDNTTTPATQYESYYEISGTTLTAYLSLRTQVHLRREGGLTFLLPDEGNEDEGIVTIRAEIVLDNDETLKGQSNVSLFYHKRGSDADSEGLYADLTWRNGYYEGEFNATKGGIFNFDRLQIGNEHRITNALTAPTITVRDEKPVRVNEGASNVYYRINDVSDTPGLLIMAGRTEGYYMLGLENADTAENIRVEMTDPNGNKYIVPVAEYGKNNTYYFRIPTKDASGRDIAMDGTWSVDAVFMQEVYDAEGDYYGVAMADAVAEEYVYRKYFAITDPETDQVTYEQMPIYAFEIIKSLTVTVSTPGNENGIVLNDVPFMTEQSVSGISISIQPSDGRDMGQISAANVTFTLEYENNSKDYGGYTFTETTATREFNVKTVKAADGTFVCESIPVQLAGTYSITSVTYELVNGNGDVMTEAPIKVTAGIAGITRNVITLNSQVDVFISEISPNKANHQSVVGSDRNNTQTIPVTSSISSDGKSATVYSETYMSGSDLKVTTRPMVEITIDLGTASSATMLIVPDSANLYLYSDYYYIGTTDAYYWESETGGIATCQRYVGKYTEGNCLRGQATRLMAGVLTGSTVTLIHETGEYIATIDPITINNPH